LRRRKEEERGGKRRKEEERGGKRMKEDERGGKRNSINKNSIFFNVVSNQI
jgi:hypothetical protein